MIPHPQRCETCKKYSERAHPIYEGNIIAFCGEERTQVETKAITSNHGCASHSSHTPAPAPTFSEEECEYLEELILDNIEQYPDSGSFTPEKRDALYQKIAFKMQAGDP